MTTVEIAKSRMIHAIWLDQAAETTYDVMESAKGCPVLTGADVNEIGEDCDGCIRFDPDRYGVCQALQRGDRAEVCLDGVAVFYETGQP